MKYAGSLLAFAAGLASAHYNFPDLFSNGALSSDWQYVRETTNFQSNGPVTDVTSDQIRCYELAGRPQANTSTVKAGSTIGFKADNVVTHPGPIQFYMAKVPSGQTAATFDGSGSVWFKIHTEEPTIDSTGLVWASTNQQEFQVPIPAATPSGDYLVRIEHIALHQAQSQGGAQFYLACGQLTVTNGGSGSPGPKIAFPGGYSATDPGILINIYYPVPTSYTPPGPAVWSG
ncbi:lytic polysaccharide monooxygenase [Viridothelium virens]|uniref:lytic cellulose monooxygenase (C4-dehydrogenating) n=1 Tax=Viridothelium virens TaxID=1048519 RepID=A0A6A6GY22_VIRVR|nr:lytic polysaccharide monooxygenase [Viridothelium virens]